MIDSPAFYFITTIRERDEENNGGRRENIICLSRRRHSSCASAKQISSLTSFAELQRSPDKPIRRERNFGDGGVSKSTVGSGHNANNAATFDPLSILRNESCLLEIIFVRRTPNLSIKIVSNEQ